MAATAATSTTVATTAAAAAAKPKLENKGFKCTIPIEILDSAYSLSSVFITPGKENDVPMSAASPDELVPVHLCVTTEYIHDKRFAVAFTVFAHVFYKHLEQDLKGALCRFARDETYCFPFNKEQMQKALRAWQNQSEVEWRIMMNQHPDVPSLKKWVQQATNIMVWYRKRSDEHCAFARFCPECEKFAKELSDGIFSAHDSRLTCFLSDLYFERKAIIERIDKNQKEMVHAVTKPDAPKKSVSTRSIVEAWKAGQNIFEMCEEEAKKDKETAAATTKISPEEMKKRRERFLRGLNKEEQEQEQDQEPEFAKKFATLTLPPARPTAPILVVDSDSESDPVPVQKPTPTKAATKKGGKEHRKQKKLTPEAKAYLKKAIEKQVDKAVKHQVKYFISLGTAKVLKELSDYLHQAGEYMADE